MKDIQEQPDKIDEMKIIQEVNIQGETLYNEAKQLGDLAAENFGEKHRSQLTGLENIAESAFKTSDIFDYIKRQSARHNHWRKDEFGKKLIESLEKSVDNRRRSICINLDIKDKKDADKQVRNRIYLLLIRQFIRQMVVQYEYQVSYGKGERRNGTH